MLNPQNIENNGVTMRILLNVYKMGLFVGGFFIRSFLALINFFIFNLVIDQLKK